VGRRLGLVEGWRGEILSFVRFGADGRITRFFRAIRHDHLAGARAADPRQHRPRFPRVHKSVNGSYSGHDL